MGFRLLDSDRGGICSGVMDPQAGRESQCACYKKSNVHSSHGPPDLKISCSWDRA